MAETLDLQTNESLKERLKRMKEENDRLKSDLNRYHVIMNNTLDAIFICRKEMKIVQANEVAARMMQIEAESLINRSVLDFLYSVPQEELNKAVKKFLKKAICGKRCRLSLTAARRNTLNSSPETELGRIIFCGDEGYLL